MKLSDFDALSFDCYGTLIDWETGIVEGFTPWLMDHGVDPNRDRVLAAFSHHETRVQSANPDMLYPQILEHVLRAAATDFAIPCSDDAATRFGASVADWPAFGDSAGALAYLKQHFKLVILSNIDRQSFASSNVQLGVDFDAIVTAQDVGSYKPDRRNFEALIDTMRDLGVEKSGILHTAESLYHDHVPAKKMGLTTAWIKRSHGQGEHGATASPQEDVTPDFAFSTLGDMAMAHRAEADT